MRRLGLALISAAVAVGMGGCVWNATPPKPLVEAVLKISILSDGRTAVLDATRSVGAELRYFWDLGAGLFEGDPIIQRNFGIGVFPVRLKVVGRGAGTPGGGGGEPGGPPGGGTPSTTEWVESWTYGVVDTALRDGPTAIILVLGIDCGVVNGHQCFAGKLTFRGDLSLVKAGPLTYRWEVVRVDPGTLQPIPYPGYSEPEYIVSDQVEWSTWLWGGACYPVGTFLYRVTLRVRDANWVEDTKVIYIAVH